ncbi:MAG TPA: phosphate acyltransferase [Spirochaetota bacterium]|nr:phosphate acyltransferase [Spirochaetota bacterium]
MFKQKVRARPRRIVFPEGDDIRVMKGLAMLSGDGLLGEAVLIGNADIINENARTVELNKKVFSVIDAGKTAKNPRYADEYRRARNLSVLEQERIMNDVNDPIVLGALMLRLGEVDAYIAGLRTSTAQILRTGLNVIKADRMIGVITAFSMVYADSRERRFKSVIGDEGVILMADPVVNSDPSVGVLCKIAEAAARYLRLYLNLEPRIAFLSYSSKGSSEGRSVDKMRIATERAREKMPEYLIDGELQLDAAISPIASELKAPENALNGNANILIFPNLDAANIGSKLVKHFGNAKLLGPIIYGLQKPFNDISRGANEFDVYDLAIVTQLQVK